MILDLYQGCCQNEPLGPGDRILSSGAKPQINARSRLHPTLPAAPGRPVRYEHEYKRKGSLALLAALDVHTGQVFASTPLTTGITPFTDLAGQVMARPEYKNAPRVFVIVDNGSDHRGQRAISRLARAHPNAIMIHTPLHASWLNQIPVNRPSVGDTRGFSEVPHLGAGRGQTRVRCLGGGVDGAACRAGWRWSPCRGVRRGRRAGQPVSCASGVAGILTGHGPGVCL